MKMQQLCVGLTPEITEKLIAEIEQTKASAAYIVRKALMQYFKL